jgi:hypothetical protein
MCHPSKGLSTPAVEGVRSGRASPYATQQFTVPDHGENPGGAADGGGQSAPLREPFRRSGSSRVVELLDPLHPELRSGSSP